MHKVGARIIFTLQPPSIMLRTALRTTVLHIKRAPCMGLIARAGLGRAQVLEAGSCPPMQHRNSKCQGDKGRTPIGSTRNSYPGTHVRPHIMAVFTNYIAAIFFYQIRKKAKFEWHICLIEIKYTEMSWNITEM